MIATTAFWGLNQSALTAVWFCAQMWLSGCPNQTRLATLFLEHVKLADFPATLEPLFHMWKVQGKKGEAFGDFSNRVVSGYEKRGVLFCSRCVGEGCEGEGGGVFVV